MYFTIITKMAKKARAWCFTLNNYTPQEIEDVKGWECKYLIFGKEVGEQGTPHLQGYVAFENAKSLVGMKMMHQTLHWEIAKGTPKQASEYCEKDGDVFEKGIRPLSQKEKGDLGKRAFEEALVAYKEKRYEDMGSMALNLKAFDYMDAKCVARDTKIASLVELEHEWFYGLSGTGKSRKAREDYPAAYIKDPKNAWWDGYAGEEVVIIDDFDKFQVKQSGDMKRWLDRYPFQAERKGAYLGLIRPKKIIITSNYHPKEIWDDSDVTLSTILRRVKVTRFDSFPTPATPGSGDGGAPARGLRLVAAPHTNTSQLNIETSRGVAEGDPPSPNRFTSLPSRFL
jgi:hypothetical protein